jgi:predicted HNH restriction endonuclease
VRRKVRSRDEVCQKCGSDGSDRLLDVHHIDPIRTFEKPEEANTMDNLILLCRSCHRAVEENQAKCPQPEAW